MQFSKMPIKKRNTIITESSFMTKNALKKAAVDQERKKVYRKLSFDNRYQEHIILSKSFSFLQNLAESDEIIVLPPPQHLPHGHHESCNC